MSRMNADHPFSIIAPSGGGCRDSLSPPSTSLLVGGRTSNRQQSPGVGSAASGLGNALRRGSVPAQPKRDLLMARIHPSVLASSSSSSYRPTTHTNNKQQMLVLEVEGASRRRGGAAILWSLNGSDHQR
jgi:hypothetical protein